MTELKLRTMKEELKEYLEYDSKLTTSQKEDLLQLNIEKYNEWMQIVHDYFYSHIDENGNIISLENYLLKNNQNIDNYKKVNNLFVDELFKNNKPLFFLDVDNTLTNFAHLSDEKKQFISAYKNKERIILSTGKTYESILNVINECKLNDNYASTLNGSILVDKGKLEIISRIGKVSKAISE